jgi:GntR family transcriptional regulator
MADSRYRVIADDLRRQIESQKLQHGDRLPTEGELQKLYKASRNTVRDAIKSLITRGLVETRPGQGTFVTEMIVPFVTTLTGEPATASGGEGNTYTQEVRGKRRQPDDSAPRVEVQKANDLVARELQLGEDDRDRQIICRSQRRFIDGTPWSLQTSFYPMRFLLQGASRLLEASDIDKGTVEYLRETLGTSQAGWRDRLFVRAPDQDETAFFKLPEDGRISVIEIRRTAFDETGMPNRLTVSVYPADRNQFALDLGKVPPEIRDPSSVAPPSASPATAAPDESASEPSE